MKTRKYFCFVCVLIIFTVVFAFTGCKDDTRENDGGGEDAGPKFRWDCFGLEIIMNNGDYAVTDVYVMGTLDELTYRRMKNRLEPAFLRLQGRERLESSVWDEEAGSVWPIIISGDIFWETFTPHVVINRENWTDYDDPRGAIVLESAPKTPKTDYYEWYKVTGRESFYDISGGDKDHNIYFFSNYTWDNILHINIDNMDNLLVPIDDGEGGQKPALAVAILALNKAVTTGVLSQR
jgi:hypothetical protein